MKLIDPLKHPLAHNALSNITPDQHHDQPENIEISNITLSISPLPGGPGIWDIAMPYKANVVSFTFRSIHTTAEGGGKAGVIGIATRSQFEASTTSVGGHATIASGAYNAAYSKKASALYLSHKVFSSLGTYIALTDAYLYETVIGTTRVLRTTWTNFGSGYLTLNCWGQVQVIG